MANKMNQINGMVADNMNTMVNKEDTTMTMEMAKQEVIDRINGVYTVMDSDGDQDLMEMALPMVTREWSMGAMEWLVRQWTNLIDEDVKTVANMVCEWQVGYRCEMEDQPTVALYWARKIGTDGFNKDIDVLISRRVGAVVAEVRSYIANGDSEDVAWNGAVVNGEWQELEIEMAKEEYKRQNDEYQLYSALREHVIAQAIELADQMNDDGLNQAIERCKNGSIKADDWNVLMNTIER